MQSDLNANEDQLQSDRRTHIASARKGAHAFRGAFLDKFARLERSLGPVLLLAASMAEYAGVASKLPHLLGQKTATLRKIAEAKGPLKGPAADLLAQLDALSKFDEMRNFMAHSVLEVAWTEHDDAIYIFRMLKLAKGQAEPSVLLMSKNEAQAIGRELGTIVNALVRKLDAITKSYPAKVTHLPLAARPPR